MTDNQRDQWLLLELSERSLNRSGSIKTRATKMYRKTVVDKIRKTKFIVHQCKQTSSERTLQCIINKNPTTTKF